MKAYKGFDKDMKCRDFQYEIGKTYETNAAELCMCGFHACEAPLDTFVYYPPADSHYCEVELDGVSDERESDTKLAAKKITVGAELNLFGLAKAHVEWVNEHLSEKAPKKTNTGYASAATNTGYASAAEVSGKGSIALAAGYQSKARGSLGCAIIVAERGDWNGETYPLLSICAAIVDGEKIKPDVWYTAHDGQLVEVEGE